MWLNKTSASHFHISVAEKQASVNLNSANEETSEEKWLY